MQIDLVPQLGSAAIRAFGLGLLTFLASFLFRIRSPAALHAAWTVVLAGMLLQIPLGVLAPAVRLTALQTLSYSGPPRVVESAGAFSPALQSVTRTSRAHTEPNGRRLSLSEVFTGLYLGVSMLLFARMGLGAWGLHRILRDAKPIPSVGPGVLESRSFVVPASAGCFRAKIFLPPAWSDWGAGKLRAVLAHERAHITRQDWLIRVASHVNVCLFWFHPLAWWMERELARLAEEACDDIALSAIGNREDYAEALVDIARAAADSSLTWEIISMAKESNVTRRVNRILEARLPAPKPFGRLAWGDAPGVQRARNLSVCGSEVFPCKSGTGRVKAGRSFSSFRSRGSVTALAGTEIHAEADRASASESIPPARAGGSPVSTRGPAGKHVRPHRQ